MSAATNAQHPDWCTACLTDPASGERIHRSISTQHHGDHEARTVIAAADGEPPRLFVEVLPGDHGLTATDAAAITKQIATATAVLPQPHAAR